MKLFWRMVAAACLATLIFSPHVFGDYVGYTNNTTADTDYNNPANYISASNHTGVPTAADVLLFYPGFVLANVGGTGIFPTPNGPLTITETSATPNSLLGLQVSSEFDNGISTNGGNFAGILNLSFTGASTLTIGTDGAIINGGVTVNYSGNLTLTAGSLVVGTNISPVIDPVIPPPSVGPGTLNLTSGIVNLDSAAANSFIVGQNVTTSAGTVNQGTGSTVITGSSLAIGSTGGIGAYNVNSGATLDIGTLGAPDAAAYTVTLGAGSALTVNASTLNAANVATTITVGDGTTTSKAVLTETGASTFNLGANTINIGIVANSSGEFDQSGGTLNLNAGSNLNLGGGTGTTGVYNLSGDATSIANLAGTVTVSSTGTFIQSGGVANQTGTMTIAAGGTYTQSGGTANFSNLFTATPGGNFGQSGGTANFNAGFLVNPSASYAQSGGTAVVTGGSEVDGTLNQSGGITTITGGSTIGGTFNQSAGATTADTMTVNGAVNQTGGSITVSQTGGTSNLTINGTFLVGGTLATSGELVGNTGLNFNGGTLQTAAGGAGYLLDDFTSTISAAGATLDNSNGDIVIVGALNGSGALNIIGGNNVFFASPNTYTGGTTISGDSTLASDPLNIPAGTITFGAGGGTLDLSQNAPAGNRFLNNTVVGTGGNLVTPDAVTLELGGPDTFTGTTFLGTGSRLQVFNGTFGDSSDSSSVAFQASNGSVVIGGASLVAGAATPPTSGTVYYNGEALYTGLTTVNPNFSLIITNTMSTGLAGALTNNGTFGPALNGMPTGSIPIGGNLISTGTLLANATPLAHDSYDVTGTAALSGLVSFNGVGTITIPNFITATGGITIGAGGLTLMDVGPLLSVTSPQAIGMGSTFAPGAVGTTIQANIIQDPTMPYAQTPNQRAISQAIDPFIINPTAAFIPFVQAFDSLNASQIPGALQQLSPQSLQYMGNITLENTTFMTQNVDGHLADLRSGYSGLDSSGLSIANPGFDSSLGRSLMAYYAPAPNGVNYYHQNPDDVQNSGPSQRVISDSPDPLTSPTREPAPSQSRFSEFISGDVILANIDQSGSTTNPTSSKATYTAGNATAGVSFRMTNNLAAGVLFDYTHTDAKTDNLGSKTKVDSYSPGIFGTFFKNGFYANGLFSYGYNQYTNDRNINFGNLNVINSTAKSSPDGNQYVANADFGYDFQPDKHVIIGPTLGLQYTHLDIGSFSENGAGPVDLAVNEEQLDSLRSRLGAHFIYQVRLGSVMLQPHVSAAWQHEFLDTSYGINGQFALPASFSYQTTELGRDSALLSFGLTATLDTSLSAYLNYLAEVGQDDLFVQSVQGGIKAQF